MTHFADRLSAAVLACGAPACVGLDPHLDRLPLPLVESALKRTGRARRSAMAQAAAEFCIGVLDVVARKAPAVKPQVAFFEQLGAPGVEALEHVVAHAKSLGLIVILDAKRGDIGSTAKAYVTATLSDDGPMGADAVTLSPYLGLESLQPFVEAISQGKGLFVLVRTSNPGAQAWQLGSDPIAGQVADWIRETNAGQLGDTGMGPVGAVIGATLPLEAPRWRRRMPNAWFLVPGYGAQGASATDCLAHCRDDRSGALISSSRGVLYPRTGRAGSDWKRGINDRLDEFVCDLSSTFAPSVLR
ncbi:MAG: orotidine-5'-phosphate decarboxylase [Kiritimatiellia bacterium]|jgi:orotidine-5'-phosphate decarboxylase